MIGKQSDQERQGDCHHNCPNQVRSISDLQENQDIHKDQCQKDHNLVDNCGNIQEQFPIFFRRHLCPVLRRFGYKRIAVFPYCHGIRQPGEYRPVDEYNSNDDETGLSLGIEGWMQECLNRQGDPYRKVYEE